MSRVSLIAAMANNRVIGIDNKLPWRLPADLAWFKKTTMAKPLIMGRKTWESLPFRPLPGRKHFVISRDNNYQLSNAKGELLASSQQMVSLAHSLEDAIAAAKEYCQEMARDEQNPDNELMIIGGASIYLEAITRCDRMYLTLIDEDIQGDAWFPEYHQDDWQIIEQHPGEKNEDNPHQYQFLVLDRKN